MSPTLLQTLLNTDLSKIDFFKVSSHSVLGGITVYVGARSQGIAEYPSILLGILAAVGAGFGSASNTQKDADTPQAAPAADDSESEAKA